MISLEQVSVVESNSVVLSGLSEKQMQSYRINQTVVDGRSPNKQQIGNSGKDLYRSNETFQTGYRESELLRTGVMSVASFPKNEDGRDGVNRGQFNNFPTFRDFGNSSTSSGTVVVDVLPPLYTQADFSHARDKMLDSPDEDRDSPVLDKNSKNDALKGKEFV